MPYCHRSSLVIVGALIVAGGGLASAPAGPSGDRAVAVDSATLKVQQEPRRSSLVQRQPRPWEGDAAAAAARAMAEGQAIYPDVFRTITGEGNNIVDPLLGAAGTDLLRLLPAEYSDGAGAPSGEDRPSARAVSNALVSETEVIENSKGASDYIWQWGQFIDHDITETPFSDTETFDIRVPPGDPWFDPIGTGTETIALDRSAGRADAGGVRQQLNNITSFIDASLVYGSEHERAEALRTLDGTGRLKVGPGNLLPLNFEGLENADDDENEMLFLAGDVRANEQVALTAMHTLWVREHNRLADEIATEEPKLTGEEIYERARAIVAGLIQAITYERYLPLLLGDGAIPEYAGYDPSVNPQIANVFATAAYRFGHSQLSPTLLRVDEFGRAHYDGDLPLRDAFFNPAATHEFGIDPTLRGLAFQTARRVDRFVVDDVRNFLFGPPGAGGFDLASLNMQRGRDHAIPGYNDWRAYYGLPRAGTFADINPSPDVQAALAAVYSNPDEVDAWVGMLSEPRRAGAMVGETLSRAIRDQFTRLRDGDRFWYERYLPADLAEEIRATTLADVIRRNTDIGDELPDDVFLAEQRRPVCLADLTRDDVLSGSDVAAFIDAFGSGGDAADIAAPEGVVDGADVNAFISAFALGCP